MHVQPIGVSPTHCRPYASAQREDDFTMVGGSEQREAMLRFTVMLNAFCNGVLALDGVRKVGIKARGESFSVWTFVDNPSHEVLSKIFTAELGFGNAMPNMIFDFAVKYLDTASVPHDFYVFQVR